MSHYFLDLLTMWVIFAVSATVVSTLVEQAGFLHVGAAALVGVGAYATAILSTRLDVDPQLALLATVPVGISVGVVLHLVVGRLTGDVLALATLAVAIVLHGLMLNAVSLTGGPMGIAGIPNRPPISGDSALDAIIFLVLVVGAQALVRRSKFGMRMRAIREDEDLAADLGLRPRRVRWVVWVTSSTVLTVAGGLFAFHLRFIDPSSFTVRESVSILAMSLLFPWLRGFGGSAGALVFIALPEILRFLGLPGGSGAELRQLLFGIGLLIVVARAPWARMRGDAATGGARA